MALLFLSNKLINLSEIRFVRAENQTEKVISTYSKFKYEQALLGFEMGIYMTIFSIFARRVPPRIISNGCAYNYDKKIVVDMQVAHLLVLPISVYRAIDYIKNHNQQIIEFKIP